MYNLALCLIFCLSVSHAMQGPLTDAQQMLARETYAAKNNSVVFWKLHPSLTNETLQGSGKGPCTNVQADTLLFRGYLKSCRKWQHYQSLGICDLSCGGHVMIMCWQKKNWYPLNDVTFCSEAPERSCKAPLPTDGICSSITSKQNFPMHSKISCVCSKNCRELTLTCTADGIWTGDSECNSESYLDGALSIDVNETNLFFSCDENHRLVGQNNSTCLNGLLSEPKPVCEAVEDVQFLLYCVPLVIILTCLCIAAIMFILRRRKSNVQLRNLHSQDNELQAVHRPDTSHYEDMNAKCDSVIYDDVCCNADILPFPEPEYINSSEPYLPPIGNRRVLKTK